jgi:hypothetical protein
MFSRMICTLLIVLWLIPLSLVREKDGYRPYKRSRPVWVEMFGLRLRLIIQEDDEQKLLQLPPEQLP